VGYPIPVPQEFIQMTLVVGALTFRYKFLDPLVEDIKLTLLARNRA
jgi:hypothetical protein